jgi:hypothetical protein
VIAIEASLPATAGRWEGRCRGARQLGKRAAIRAPERWELEILRLLAEQTAVPFDQLARFLGCETEQAARIAKHLTKAGYADYGRTLMYEPHWVWLTHRGARFSGLGFKARRPTAAAMARMRAVNEIRIYIAARAPEARWISSRGVVREQGRRGHRPNAVVEIGAERHAITVHLRRAQQRRLCHILESHMARYDAVIAFAAPAPRRLLERLCHVNHWPKLIVRAIPAVS